MPKVFGRRYNFVTTQLGVLMRLLPLILITLCLNFHASADDGLSGKKKNSISIMAYNVENLFDTQHDDDKNDWEFLPLDFKKDNPEAQEACKAIPVPFYRENCFSRDWSESVLEEKLKRVADTILAATPGGPDVLLLEEIENMNVLEQLNNYLAKANYQTVELIEGDDGRGIDVAVLSRLPLAGESELHRIKFRESGKTPRTRGILDVPLELPTGDTLYAMAAHLPSQANPVWQRLDAIDTINSILASKGKNALVIAGGDFNTSPEENQKYKTFDKLLGSVWDVSHLKGCKGCKGTYLHKGKWNFLDVLLFSPALSNGKYKVSWDKIRVPNKGRYQTGKQGRPERFNNFAPVGVSDHLPIYGEISW